MELHLIPQTALALVTHASLALRVLQTINPSTIAHRGTMEGLTPQD